MSESVANYLGWRGSPVGDYMKSTYGWNDGGNGINSSGFNGLPGGIITSWFDNGGIAGYWWSTSEYAENEFYDSHSWRRTLIFESDDVSRYNFNRSFGFSARCVRDD